jgi:hypothetical protein
MASGHDELMICSLVSCWVDKVRKLWVELFEITVFHIFSKRRVQIGTKFSMTPQLYRNSPY